ncbi:MAG: ComEC family competence protein [Alphaproteobacteria bacterium]|nr:ComEC family competence protein [Alphaproteobacteria bacterium]
MNIKNFISSSFYGDLHRWFLWVPVFFGCGISVYFSLYEEPSILWGYGGVVIFLLSLIVVRLQLFKILFLAVGFMIFGFSVALFRTHLLRTTMLHYSLPSLILEGEVAQVELKPTKAGNLYQRLLLTNLKAETAENLPQKVRLSLKGKRERVWPGQVIRLRAKLMPISDPGIPQGFDFRRQAYFNGLGATGFALSPPEVLRETFGWQSHLAKKREKITDYFLKTMSPPLGAIAAALITGDKAAIPEKVREDFINSGLAHILAISGLHLTIIAGVVFAVFRRGIALIPPLCLAFNSKKLAAAATIFMTFLYLVLSGFGIPAQRAFIMITVVMGAILLDRTALSMRTVALAAFVILLLMPESLLGPSFQLSFAAVIVLVAGYETWRNPLSSWMVRGGILRKKIAYCGGLIFTSLLATLATLPFTIYLFHRFSVHAILANLVAVPLTSLVIMPLAFLTCVLTPLGLGDFPLWVFEKSLSLLLQIAEVVSSWPGSHIWVSHPPLSAFILTVFGGLWFCLWHQPWRRLGLLPLTLGCVLGFQGNLPQVLIDGQGKLVGLHEGNNLYVSSSRKGKFTAETWQKYLAAKEVKPMACDEGVCQSSLQGIPLIVSSEKERQPCVKEAILIRLEPSEQACPEARLVIGWYDIWKAGGYALWLTEKNLHIEKVRESQGMRPWTGRAIRRRDRPSQLD